MNIQTLVQDIFDNHNDLQLATASGGQPWVSTVYFAADDEHRLYWASTKTRRHSIEIVDNPKVAVTIVMDNKQKQALQIVGEAHEVTEDEIEHAHETYCARYGDKPGLLAAILDGDPEGPAYWVCTPTDIELYDEINFPKSPKQQVSPL